MIDFLPVLLDCVLKAFFDLFDILLEMCGFVFDLFVVFEICLNR